MHLQEICVRNYIYIYIYIYPWQDQILLWILLQREPVSKDLVDNAPWGLRGAILETKIQFAQIFLRTETPPNDTLPWTIYSEEAAGGSSFRFGNVTGHCHLDGWLGRPLVSDQPSENSKRSLINCQEEVLLPPSLSICHFLLLLTFTNTILISPSILRYSSSREGRCRP